MPKGFGVRDGAPPCDEGDEPLRTLKSYRWDKALRGVAFGQNLIVVSGAGARLCVGTKMEACAAVNG